MNKYLLSGISFFCMASISAMEISKKNSPLLIQSIQYDLKHDSIQFNPIINALENNIISFEDFDNEEIEKLFSLTDKSNLSDAKNLTLLMIAAKKGNTNIVQNIVTYPKINQLKRKHIINLVDPTKKLPALFRALHYNKLECAELLLQNGAQNKERFLRHFVKIYKEANHKEDIARLALLLKYFANPNEPDEEGFTVLTRIMQLKNIQNKLPIIEFLIEKGANLKTEDKHGKKAKDYTENDDLKELLEAYELYDCRRPEDLIDKCATNNDIKTLKYLFNIKTQEEKKVLLLTENIHSQIPLTKAVINKRKEAVEFLLQEAKSLGITQKVLSYKNQFCNSPFFEALDHKYDSIRDLLLSFDDELIIINK
ncbi:MAG: ankyrin repeat domain-containing protein [Candidatus Babeliales bacterium]